MQKQKIPFWLLLTLICLFDGIWLFGSGNGHGSQEGPWMGFTAFLATLTLGLWAFRRIADRLLVHDVVVGLQATTIFILSLLLLLLIGCELTMPSP